jgi:hypothetical protein
MPVDRRKISALNLALAAVALLASLRPASAQVPPVGLEAKKVIDLIDRIERETSSAPGPLSRKEAISEAELNAYIAHRIVSEKQEIMKVLELKLFPESRIEGRVLIDLSGRKIPTGLRPRMNILFSGTLMTRAGKVRMELDSFYLEEQKIQPALLDLIISLVSRLEGLEPWKIDDWHDLPYGLREMRTEQGRLCVEY